MDRKKEIKEELEQISPFLADLKKENPFKVPANYFDDLSDQVLEKARPSAASESVGVKNGPGLLDQLAVFIQRLFQPQYAVGFATVALLIVAGLFFLKNDEDPTLATSEELTLEEATDYLAANIDEFDTDLLMSVEFGEDEIDEISLVEIGEEEFNEVLEDLLEDFDEEDLEELL